MGSFRQYPPPQAAVQDLPDQDLLLDDEFDIEIDVSDEHLLTLELSSQFSSTLYN